MTPLQKADGVKAKHNDRFQRLMQEAQTLIHIPRNLDYRANRMLAVADELTSMVAPVAPCKKGCSHCCYQSAVMSDWEAKRIAKKTGRKIANFVGYAPKENGRDELIEAYKGKPCTFLKDGQCSIYDVRPFSCRLHYSMADTEIDCDIILRPGSSVPYFNFKQLELYVAYLFVSDDCKFGDIRQFFPMGD